jgi:hypothetical protein
MMTIAPMMPNLIPLRMLSRIKQTLGYKHSTNQSKKGSGADQASGIVDDCLSVYTI